MLPWVLLSVFYRVSSWRWRSKKEIGSSSVECWMVVVEEKQANIPPVKWVLVRVYVWARVERDLRQITTTEKSAPISSVIVLLKWCGVPAIVRCWLLLVQCCNRFAFHHPPAAACRRCHWDWWWLFSAAAEAAIAYQLAPPLSSFEQIKMFTWTIPFYKPQHQNQSPRRYTRLQLQEKPPPEFRDRSKLWVCIYCAVFDGVYPCGNKYI